MFSKLAVLASLAILAVATPTPGGSGPGPNGGDGPANLCCVTTQSAGSPAGAALLGSIGVVLQDLNVLIGGACSPITGVGVSGTSCTNAPVNCQDFYSKSLIGINCTPIIVNA